MKLSLVVLTIATVLPAIGVSFDVPSNLGIEQHCFKSQFRINSYLFQLKMRLFRKLIEYYKENHTPDNTKSLFECDR